MKKFLIVIVVIVLVWGVAVPVAAVSGTWGDVNQDGRIDAKDALTVLQHTVGKARMTEEAGVLADVNGDGAWNAADSLLILKKSVEKLRYFPVEITPVTFEAWDGTLQSESQWYINAYHSGAWHQGNRIEDSVLCRSYEEWEDFVNHEGMINENPSFDTKAAVLAAYSPAYFEEGGSLLLFRCRPGSSRHCAYVRDVYLVNHQLQVELQMPEPVSCPADLVAKLYTIELRGDFSEMSAVHYWVDYTQWRFDEAGSVEKSGTVEYDFPIA